MNLHRHRYLNDGSFVPYNKRKAKEGGAGRTGSSDKGEALAIRGKLGWWTPHAKFNFRRRTLPQFSEIAFE